ncbi:MAG TPA: right-handed parallel beta-helix repeat-containing protein, partial [Steroidobacteraceae bacterium]|nr:right-handed parallel beta-helix repeat-containing protein [Steroidobacteraceae bacterium]
LAAGEFELAESWRIDGAALPVQVVRWTISGAAVGTRLTGARSLATLDARVESSANGTVDIDLPAQWRARLAQPRSHSSDDAAWPSLFDSQGALRLARWPREGWALFTGPAGDENTIRAENEAPLAEWRDETSAWTLGFFKYPWHADYLRLVASDDLQRTLRLSGQGRTGIGPAGRYRVLNLRSALRASGEYWFDAARGRLIARPHEGSSHGTLRLTVLTEPLLHLRNVQAFEIMDLTFAATRGHAVVVENSSDIVLSRLMIRDIGRSGVVADGGRDVRIRGSSIVDVGQHAVLLRGGDRAQLRRAGHHIENSRISRPSQRLDTPASAIRLEGVGQVVRGNTIEDAPHSAVYYEGNDHLIEANWIGRVCLDVSDAGAIYAGRDWTARGTVIRRNVFTHLQPAIAGGMVTAIYLDDMMSGTRIENNAIVDAQYGVLVGGGRDNIVTKNLFLSTHTPLHVDERALTWAHRAVAPGEVMDKRLNAMPVRDATWAAAYPLLASMRRDRAPMPEGNQIRSNVVSESGAPSLVPMAVSTGIIEAPVELTVPKSVRTAEALLDFCIANKSCMPFDPAGVPARPVRHDDR